MTQRIAIASDHAGVELKETLKHDLGKLGYDIHDLGTSSTQSVDYPDFANELAAWMKKNPESYGVLICGSGIGMSIAANRHRHVRAALVCTPEQAALSRQHNNANVLCLGARQINAQAARDCLQHFLASEFEGGRHASRVTKFS